MFWIPASAGMTIGSCMEEKRSYKKQYILAALFCLVGIAAGITMIIQGFRALGQDSQRVVVPGAHDVHFPQAGKYQLAYEYKSVLGDRTYATPETFPDFQMNLNHP